MSSAAGVVSERTRILQRCDHAHFHKIPLRCLAFAQLITTGLRRAGIGDAQAFAVVGDDCDDVRPLFGARGGPLRIEQTEQEKADAGGAQRESDGDRASLRCNRPERQPGERHENDRSE